MYHDMTIYRYIVASLDRGTFESIFTGQPRGAANAGSSPSQKETGPYTGV